MRILIIKTSSMGDVIHTLPAVTELYLHHKNVKIDWVVEDSFKDIPKYHKHVNKVIPIAIRKWRKNIFNKVYREEIKQFLEELQSEYYDHIIDAQGLLKSALITRLVRSENKDSVTHGLDAASSRGQYISWLYDKQYYVDRNLHAIHRLKILFSKVFNYQVELGKLNYGLTNADLTPGLQKPYLVFLHCTTWSSKKWPKHYWQQLITFALQNRLSVKLNSGNQQEFEDAQEILNGLDSTILQKYQGSVEAMSPQSIPRLMHVLSNCKAVVSVDTGLGHLAAALDKPGVGIFGSTNSILTGFLSNKFKNLQSQYECSPCLNKSCNKIKNPNDAQPCFANIHPVKVWEELLKII